MQESQEQQKSDNENIAHKPKKAPEKKKEEGRQGGRPNRFSKQQREQRKAGQERASEVESRQVKRNPQTVKQHRDENDS